MALEASTRVHDAFAHYYLPKIALLERKTTSNVGYHTVRLPLGGKSMADTDAERIVNAIQRVKTHMEAGGVKGGGNLGEGDDADGDGGGGAMMLSFDHLTIPLLTEIHLGGNPHLTEPGLLIMLEALAAVPLIISRLTHISLDYPTTGAEDEYQQFSLSENVFAALKKLIILSGALRTIDVPAAPEAGTPADDGSSAVDYSLRQQRLKALLELNDYPKVVKAGLIAAHDNDYHLTTLDFSEPLLDKNDTSLEAGFYCDEESHNKKQLSVLSRGLSTPLSLPPTNPLLRLQQLGESEEEGTEHSDDYLLFEGLPAMRALSYNLLTVKAVTLALCSSCVTIVRLDFTKHCIGDEATKVLCQTLEINTSLTELTVDSCSIGTEGGLAIIDALNRSCNQSLTELNANDNNLNDIVATGFLELIVNQNTQLAFVSLDNNCISQSVMSRLSEELMLSTQPLQLREMVPALYNNLGKQIRVVINQSGAEQLLTDTSVRVLMHALRNNTQVRHVDLSNNELTDDAAIFLGQIIEGSGPASDEVSSGEISATVSSRPSSALMGVPPPPPPPAAGTGSSVRKMILQANHLTDAGATVLLAAVSHNEKLEQLDLRYQRSPSPGISQLILDQIELMVQLNRHPRDLRCVAFKLLTNDPEATEVNLLRPDPQKKCTNETINLIRQIIDLHREPEDEEDLAAQEEGVRVIDVNAVPGIRYHPLPPPPKKPSASCITSVMLGGNSVFVSAHAIPDLVVIANHVAVLDLSATMLDEQEFIHQFVPVLRTNTCLKKLDISKNTGFTDATIAAIILAIRQKNHTLREIDASGCPEVSKDALEELAYVCSLNVHIEGDLDEGLPAISEAFGARKLNFKNLLLAIEASKDPRVTEVLLMDFDRLGVRDGTSNSLKRAYDDDSCKWLVRAMAGNTFITKIDLTGNALTDASVPYLCNLIQTNVTLAHLNISYNHLTDSGLSAIGRALKLNASLKAFIFDGNNARPSTIRALNSSITANVIAEGIPEGTVVAGGSGVKAVRAANVTLYSSLHDRAKPAVMTPTEHATHLDKVLEDAIFQDAMADKERMLRAAAVKAGGGQH